MHIVYVAITSWCAFCRHLFVYVGAQMTQKPNSSGKLMGCQPEEKLDKGS